jgi:ABC-type uncharacterized transport system permease subunit
MKKDILYFIAQTKLNIKNAYALKNSFYIGVFSMMLNNVAFFLIWLLFMKATGPINGWTSIDVFGMLGVSMFCYGVTYGFFYGVIDLPQFVVKSSFDSVLIAPVGSFVKLSGASFSITALGDLAMGMLVMAFYIIYMKFSIFSIILFFFSVLCGAIIFLCIRLICSLVVFFIHDGEVISNNMFEIFLRPGLYPGSIFPDKLKLFCMTILPSLITSATPIDVIKSKSFSYFLFALLVTFVWVCITYFIFKFSIKRYESGNFLR